MCLNFVLSFSYCASVMNKFSEFGAIAVIPSP